MDFKIVPFVANIAPADNTSRVANQLQSAIDLEENAGWKYERMETVQTYVSGSGGCFGIGAQPGYNIVLNVLVFSKA